MSEAEQHDLTDEDTTVCAVHPDRETGLRCNKCDRYMCGDCAVSTPVGYRCKQCVRQIEDKFYNTTQIDYPLLFITGAVLSALASLIPVLLPFWIITLILAIPIGGFISEAAVRVTQKRRGRYSAQSAAAGVVAGNVAFMLLVLGGIAIILLIYGGIMAYIVHRRFRMRG